MISFLRSWGSVQKRELGLVIFELFSTKMRKRCILGIKFWRGVKEFLCV